MTRDVDLSHQQTRTALRLPLVGQMLAINLLVLYLPVLLCGLFRALPTGLEVS